MGRSDGLLCSRRTECRNEDTTRTRVEAALAKIVAASDPVSFYAVAKEAGVARSTLYRRNDLREMVESVRRDPNGFAATHRAHRKRIDLPKGPAFYPHSAYAYAIVPVLKQETGRDVAQGTAPCANLPGSNWVRGNR